MMTAKHPLVILLLIAVAPSYAQAYEWEYLGLKGVATTCIEADPYHERILVGTLEGFHYYDTTTGVWTERDDEGSIGRRACAIQWLPSFEMRLITGRENAFYKGYLELTDDLGVTHEIVHMSQGGRFVDLDYDGIYVYACSISDIRPGELLRSPDGGQTWEALSGHGHTAMTAVVVGQSGDLYVAGDGLVSLSWDRGDTWEPIGEGLPPVPYVTGLLATATEGDLVYNIVVAATGSALYAASDFDWAWTPVLNEPCRSLALIRGPLPWPLNQVVRFVAITQDNRLLVTNCDFAVWEDQSGILPGTVVAAAFSPADGGLYICTTADGVYRAQVLTAASDPPSAPAVHLALRPNPFNPRTTVTFTLPGAGRVQVAIFGAEGQMVTRLVDETLAAGTHTVDWGGRNTCGASMPSGTYVCRLSTPWGVAVRKLSLLR